MTSERKNRIGGILATILFHVGLLMLLLFMALRTPLPLPGEEGVEVNLGFDETGMGADQQETPAPMEIPPQPSVQQPEPDENDYLVQDIEEAPVIEKKKEEPKKKIPETVKKQPETIPEKAEPTPEPQPKSNPKAIFKGKSTTSNSGGQEGISGAPGDQGNPNGTPGSENYEGGGGAGNGISFSLGGRGSVSLHKPSYDSKEQGKVVVTIKVDRQGNVTSAVPGAKGTNVSDNTLWNLAKDAALRSKFKEDSSAPEYQVGTITYNFIRQN
jgi:outer membrane biosynthesis protein TonB